MNTQQNSNLLEKLTNKDFPAVTICVIGLGYVGLPLAVRFAKMGFIVKGVDINPSLIRAIEKRQSPITEVSDADLNSVLDKNLSAILVDKEYGMTARDLRDKVTDSDIFCVCVPTPVDYKNGCRPEIKYLTNSAVIVRDSCGMDPGRERLVVVESTTYPGCTRQIMKDLDGLDTNVHLAYSPERTNPGVSTKMFWEITKVVGAKGGQNGVSSKMVTALYDEPVFTGGVLDVGSKRAAELVKCAENGFRLVSISFANEMARLATERSGNVWPVFKYLNGKNDGYASVLPRGESLTLGMMLEGTVPGFDHLHKKHLYKKLASHQRAGDDVSVMGIRSLAENTYNDIMQYSTQDTNTCAQRTTERVVESFCRLSELYLYQLAEFCNAKDLRIDIDRVVDGMLTKPFGLNLCFPGPGAGGHCIPVDPLYLLWKAREVKVQMKLIWEAVQINGEMPGQIMKLIGRAMNDQHRRFDGSNILILGVTYKREVPDTRESKAKDIMKSLLCEDANILYCDPVFAGRRAVLYPDWRDREYYLDVRCSVDLGSVKDAPERFYEIDPKRATNPPRYYVNKIDLNKNFLDRVKDKDEPVHCVVVHTDHIAFETPLVDSKNVYETLAEDAEEVHIIDTRNVVDPDGTKGYKNLTVWGKG